MDFLNPKALARDEDTVYSKVPAVLLNNNILLDNFDWAVIPVVCQAASRIEVEVGSAPVVPPVTSRRVVVAPIRVSPMQVAVEPNVVAVTVAVYKRTFEAMAILLALPTAVRLGSTVVTVARFAKSGLWKVRFGRARLW